LATSFERNPKVLGIWLAFEPHAMGDKVSSQLNTLSSQQMALMDPFSV